MQRHLVGWVNCLALAILLAVAGLGGDLAAAETASPPPLAAPVVAAPSAIAPAPTATIEAAHPMDADSVLQWLIARFKAGGNTMWAILFLSVLAVAHLLERACRLRRGVFAPRRMAEDVARFWKAGEFDKIEQTCARHPRSTLAKIVRFMAPRRGLPVATINEAIGEIAGRDLTTQQMLVYPLLAIATLAPLLGLFGTVIGMIECFERVAFAGSMGDPSLLADGISKALLTTAFGLVVAIPALFFYHLVRLRTRFLNLLLERDASFLVNECLLGGEVRSGGETR